MAKQRNSTQRQATAWHSSESHCEATNRNRKRSGQKEDATWRK
nr:MAG TPA: hypothetical protein [Caudoviricetes sp.]